MTPEQILAGLRDIHAPQMAANAGPAGLVLWPLVLVLLGALLVMAVIWRRRSVWRRDVLRDLSLIERTAETEGNNEGWARLALLLRRLALQRQGRHDIARLNGEPWLLQLDRLIGGDLFTNGPGRGVITFPYRNGNLDKETAGQRQGDLKATIAALRRRLPWQGVLG